MRNSNAYRLVLVLVVWGLIVATPYVFGFLANNRTPNTSELSSARTLAICSDHACTYHISGIEWGDLVPGETVTRTLYLKNLEDQNITLALSTSMWVPDYASAHLTVAAHCAECGTTLTGHVLSPKETLTVLLSLSVAAECPDLDHFSVNIVLSATAQE